MIKDQYFYDAIVTKVYDGDTITVDIDLGLEVWLKNQKIRLYGINTPEVRGKEKERGKKSRDWLRDQILNKKILLETMKDKKGKYGRYLGIVWFQNEYEFLDNINDMMVDLKLAERKEY